MIILTPPLPASPNTASLTSLLITSILNISITSSLVLLSHKLAAVSPFPRKLALTPEILHTFCPISKCPLSPRSLYITVAQLKAHLNSNNLRELFQSIFRAKQSTQQTAATSLSWSFRTFLLHPRTSVPPSSSPASHQPSTSLREHSPGFSLQPSPIPTYQPLL